MDNWGKKLLFDIHNFEYGICLALPKCENKAIKAHSIQNGRILDLLEKDGHVVMIKCNQSISGPNIEFDLIGRNIATTFRGLCGKHDNDFFKKIDSEVLESTNCEHLFLYAYRAVITEQYKVLQTASKLQSAFLAKVKANKIRGDVETPEGLFATEWMMNAYEIYLYRLEYESMLTENRFTSLKHIVIPLAVSYNTIAVSSLFSLDKYQNQKNSTPRIAFSVIPTENKRCILIASYLDEDENSVKDFMQPITSAQNDYYKKYLISKTVIENCENFVISPHFFSEWSAIKKKAILDYFGESLDSSYKNMDSEELYLFPN